MLDKHANTMLVNSLNRAKVALKFRMVRAVLLGLLDEV